MEAICLLEGNSGSREVKGMPAVARLVSDKQAEQDFLAACSVSSSTHGAFSQLRCLESELKAISVFILHP